MPSEASGRASVQRIAFLPALDSMIIPSTPSIRIRFNSPLASSSTALSETDKIAADMAETIPSFTSLESTEQMGSP